LRTRRAGVSVLKLFRDVGDRSQIAAGGRIGLALAGLPIAKGLNLQIVTDDKLFARELKTFTQFRAR
jgi:hypothetical protein